jgi:hypothetical protein
MLLFIQISFLLINILNMMEIELTIHIDKLILFLKYIKINLIKLSLNFQ